MKKSLRSIALVLALLLICASFSACKKNKGKEEESSSEITTIKIDEIDEILSTSTESVSSTNSTESVNIPSFIPSTSSSANDSGSSNTTTPKVKLLDKYKDISTSKNFYIKIKSVQKGTETTSITATNSKNDIYVQSIIPSNNVNYAILITSTDSYILLPERKEFTVIPEMSNSSFEGTAKTMMQAIKNDLNTDKMTFIESGEALDEGKKVTCEVYEKTYTESGKQQKRLSNYYFDGATLTKMYDVSTKQIILIESVSKTPNSSLFSVPSDWTSVDFSTAVSHMFNK